MCVAACMSGTELWSVWKCVDRRDILYSCTHTHTHTNTVFSRPYNPVTAPYSTLRNKSKAAVSLQQRFVCLIVHKHVHKYTYTQPRLTDKTVLQAILEPWWKYKTLSKNMPQPLDMLILYYTHNVDRKGKATLLEDQCVPSIPSLQQQTHTLNYCSEQAVMVYNLCFNKRL